MSFVDPKGIQGLSGIKMSDKLEDSSKVRRPGKRPSSPERWELAQLKHAGVLKVTEYPDFDEEGEVCILFTLSVAVCRAAQERSGAYASCW